MRIKDFEFLTPSGAEDRRTPSFIVTGGSDGSISIWSLARAELGKDTSHTNGSSAADSPKGSKINCKDKVANVSDMDMTHQVGKLLGTHDSGNRITCLKAFIMLNSTEASETKIDDSWSDEFDGIAGSDSESSNSSSS